jgi:hypothetical protein
VYGCRRCSEETNETEPCNAPIREFKSGYQAYQKPEEVPAYTGLTPGTEPYLKALNEFVVELTEEKGITVIKAYVEAVKQGWSFEGIEVDPDIQQALNDAGLSTENNRTLNNPQKEEGKDTPPVQEPVSLDNIIKAMQEEQK